MDKIRIKDFIYLDIDYLHSYVAQTEKGLLMKATMENVSSKLMQSQLNNRQVKTGAAASINLGITKVEANKAIQNETESYTDTVSEAARQLIEYALHDNVYDIFLEHAKDNDFFTNPKINNPEIGKYIEFKSTYDYIDLKLYENLLSSENLESLIMKQAKDTANNKTSETSTKEIVDTMRAISLFLPTDIMFVMDKYLAPLKTRFLRETSKEIKFKYSGEITLIGKIVSPFSKPKYSTSDKAGIIAAVRVSDSSMYELIGSLGFGNVRFCVSPIALYF